MKRWNENALCKGRLPAFRTSSRKLCDCPRFGGGQKDVEAPDAISSLSTSDLMNCSNIPLEKEKHTFGQWEPFRRIEVIRH